MHAYGLRVPDGVDSATNTSSLRSRRKFGEEILELCNRSFVRGSNIFYLGTHHSDPAKWSLFACANVNGISLGRLGTNQDGLNSDDHGMDCPFYNRPIYYSKWRPPVVFARNAVKCHLVAIFTPDAQGQGVWPQALLSSVREWENTSAALELGFYLQCSQVDSFSVWEPSNLFFCRHPTWQISYTGIRVGEATHPGPPVPELLPCIFACINPTAVHGKIRQITNCGDVVVLAETSATPAAQRAATKEAFSQGYRAVWGSPVAPMKQVEHDLNLRGVSGGVACLSRHPIRETRDPFPESWKATTRILETYVQIGGITIRIIPIYAPPHAGDTSRALAVTNFLLEMAIQRMNLNATPTIIAGDFNRAIHTLEAWSLLRKRGFVDLQSHASHIYGTPLPPTCIPRNCKNGGTRNDTFLVDPRLMPFLRHIDVLQTTDFNIHRPIRAHFSFPGVQLLQPKWKLPRSFADLHVDPTRLADAYAANAPRNIVPTADNAEQHLRDWSSCVEHSVDKAIADHHSADPLHQPRASMPGSYQGRCVPVEVRQQPVANPIRPGRHNDYQPPGEAMTMRSRHRVRQLRRIQSLLKRLQSQREQSHAELSAEWRAICKATGYATSFVEWLLNWPDMIAVPYHVPTYEQLFHIEQIVRFDTDSAVLQEVQARYQLRKYANTLDEKVAFRRNQIRTARGPQTPMITCLTEEQILEIKPSRRRQAKGPPTYFFSLPGQYDPQKTTYCGVHCVVIEFSPHGSFQILPVLGHVQLEHPIFSLVQRTEHVTPAAIQDNVAKYWNKFWQRDEAEEQETDLPWRDFLEIADRAPSMNVQHEVELTSLSVWKDGIRRLKNDSARGVCGWSAAELKLLPDLAIVHLSQILNSFTAGWPSWLLVARVVLLAKDAVVLTAAAVRPITIYSVLWRLWAGILARQPLQAWARAGIPGVHGALPGWSVSDACMRIQLAIESAHESNTPIAGFTLDLIKAFNGLPRRPALHMLKKLGCPPSIANSWYASLLRMRRVFSVGSDISIAHSATTGVAEGCPISVVIMNCFSYLAAFLISSVGATPTTYFDNWGWFSNTMTSNREALRAVLRMCDSARIDISYPKSWAWATSKNYREQWPTILFETIGHQSVPVLNEAAELGVVFHYAKKHGLLSQSSRLDQVHAILGRMTALETGIQQIGTLVQSLAWPRALFGIEFLPLGWKHFEQLRTKVTHLMLPRAASNTSTWLACNLLASGLQDPEEYAHLSVLRNLKRYVTRADPEQQTILFSRICNHSGQFLQIHGPAGVIKRTLQRINWTIDQSGNIVTNTMIRFQLAKTPWRRICEFLRDAWMMFVSTQVAHRKECQTISSLSRRATSTAFGRLEISFQRTAALQICGGYSSAARTTLWKPDEEGNCPLCGQFADSRHIILHCPALATERETYRFSDINRSAEDSIWRVPVIQRHADAPTYVFISEHLSPGELPAAGNRWIENAGPNPFFFIDGSGHNQKVPEARLSTWCIIGCDANETDFPAEHSNYKRTKRMPPCFSILAAGQTQGSQTVARAELTALTLTVEAAAAATIYTDCQANVDTWDWLATNPTHAQISTRANEDLIFRLARRLPFVQIRVLKVKAHVDPAGLPDSPQGFVHLGNMCADEGAKQAMNHIDPQILQASNRIAAGCAHDITELTGILTFAAQMVINYFQKVADKQKQDGLRNTPADKMRSILAWNPAAAALPQPVFDPAFCDAFMWGTAYLQSVQQWMAELKWPAARTAGDPGISHLELLVNWMVCSGMEVPIVIPSDKRPKHPRFCDAYTIRVGAQDPIVYALPWSWKTAVNNFENALRVLQRRTDVQFLPWHHKARRAGCLTLFGASQPGGGFYIRPVLPHLSDTLQAMQKGYENSKEFTLPRDWHLKTNTPRVCHVIMSEAELHEGPFQRFERWRALQMSEKKQKAGRQ